MFYETKVRGHVRVEPKEFSDDPRQAILNQLNEEYQNLILKDIGIIIAIAGVDEVGDGILIPGDGAIYYESIFRIYVYKPEIQEVILGRVNEITDFGAFLDLGAIDGMIHVTQTMDDYVTFSKSNSLTGKQSKKTLKVGDLCRARVIAISFKDPVNPKIGLTMRQHRLGNLKWIEEDMKKEKKAAKAAK